MRNLKPLSFFLGGGGSFLFALACERSSIKTDSTENRCYRTGIYTVCRRARAPFSSDILQAGAVKWLKAVVFRKPSMLPHCCSCSVAPWGQCCIFYFVFVFNTYLSVAGNSGRTASRRSSANPFLQVRAVFSCVQTMVWLLVFGIFNVLTDVDTYDFTRGLYRTP